MIMIIKQKKAICESSTKPSLFSPQEVSTARVLVQTCNFNVFPTSGGRFERQNFAHHQWEQPTLSSSSYLPDNKFASEASLIIYSFTYTNNTNCSHVRSIFVRCIAWPQLAESVTTPSNLLVRYYCRSYVREEIIPIKTSCEQTIIYAARGTGVDCVMEQNSNLMIHSRARHFSRS
jgi:hypothetical protein